MRSTFYTSEAEKDDLQRAAKKDQMSYAAFLHLAAQERARGVPIFRQKDFRAMADMHNQIRKAGVNLNQLLHNLYLWSDGDTTRMPDGQAVTEASKDITETLEKFRTFMNEFSAAQGRD